MSETAVKKNDGILKVGLILFAITFVTALLLGVVNYVTEDRIEELKIQATRDAMQRIVPEAADFAEETLLDDPGIVTAAYAAQKDGETVAHCLEVQPSGFGGVLTLIVGVDPSGKVLGVSITNHSETPGLGANAENQLFLNQYDGKTGPFSVVKSGATQENDIEALTGATVTSKAVTTGVEAAVAYAGRLG